MREFFHVLKLNTNPNLNYNLKSYYISSFNRYKTDQINRAIQNITISNLLDDVHEAMLSPVDLRLIDTSH